MFSTSWLWNDIKRENEKRNFLFDGCNQWELSYAAGFSVSSVGTQNIVNLWFMDEIMDVN